MRCKKCETFWVIVIVIALIALYWNSQRTAVQVGTVGKSNCP